MTLPRGDGLYLRRDHYGAVTCPWCAKVAQRCNPAQLTCGREGCRQHQNRWARLKRTEGPKRAAEYLAGVLARRKVA